MAVDGLSALNPGTTVVYKPYGGQKIRRFQSKFAEFDGQVSKSEFFKLLSVKETFYFQNVKDITT